MDPKSTVVKSKSSNSGISKPREDRKTSNKKSRSNAEFPPHGIKKRGVYVEKRLTKPNLANDKKDEAQIRKPPSRPPPGQKRFVASVLTILSKSTTGTQYPEVKHDENSFERKGITSNARNKERHTKNHSKKNQVDVEENALSIPSPNKEKFRSRVLRKKFVREDKKKMVVLQSKKEIAQTPSNYSDWSYKDASQRSNTSSFINDGVDKNIEDSNIANDLKNAILEGRNIKKVKKLRYLEEEPKTLVSDGPKDPKNLYNFFVDLLETTISVYNVAADYDSTAPIDTSKTNLKINESVANKLNIDTDKLTTNDLKTTFNALYHDYENDNEDNFEPAQQFLVKHSRDDIKFRSARPKLKTNSFISRNKINAQPQKSRSVEINRRATFKNKNDLINVLKQELEEDAHVIEEPKSIFQALRIMARNKKRISFDPKTFTDECVLKRRNVIPNRKRRQDRKTKNDKNKNDAINKIFKPVNLVRLDYNYKFNSRKKYEKSNKKFEEVESVESYPSLEVYGVDYETVSPKINKHIKSEDFTLTYHSSRSDFDFDVTDAILNPTSAYSSLRKF